MEREPRSLRDIIPPTARMQSFDSRPSNTPQSTNQRAPSAPQIGATFDGKQSPLRAPKKKTSWIRYMLAGIITMLVLVGIAVSIGKTTLTIAPRVERITADAVSVSLDRSQSDDLFRTTTLEDTFTKAVAAEGVEKVNLAAEGTVTLTNNSAIAQPLVKNTRLETKDGLIFKLSQAVTIPKKMGSTPGSIAVRVYAAQTGEAYNVQPTVFTIPGLKGTAQGSLITGSSSVAFTGGFSGERPIVSTATKSAIVEALRQEAVKKFLKEAKDKTPDNHLFFESIGTTTISLLPVTAEKIGTAIISIKAVYTAPYVKADTLAKLLAKQLLADYQDEPVIMLEKTALTAANQSYAASSTTLTLTLSGEAHVGFIANVASIREALSGATLESAKTLILTRPDVDSASFSVRPLYRQTLQTDEEHMIVNVLEHAVLAK